MSLISKHDTLLLIIKPLLSTERALSTFPVVIAQHFNSSNQQQPTIKMCDRAVFMRQRFCDEIRRVNVNSHKAVKPISTTTAADVRPSMLAGQSAAGWLQLSPVRSPVIAPVESRADEAEHSFLTNFSGSNSAASSRAGSFSSSRDEAGVNAAATT